MSRRIRTALGGFGTAILACATMAAAADPPALQAPARLPTTVAAPLSVVEKLTLGVQAKKPAAEAQKQAEPTPALQLPRDNCLLPDKAASTAKNATAVKSEKKPSDADRTTPAPEKSPAAAPSAASTVVAKPAEKIIVAPPKPRVLNPSLKALRDQVRATLGIYFQQTPNTTNFTPGDILAWCLPYGCETELYHDREKINALTCLCWNYPCNGREMLVDVDGHIGARVGHGYQSHAGQLLSVLALARVPANYPLRTGRTVRSVADLLACEKLDCRSGIDLSLKLVGISFYTPPGETWKNAGGETWNVERMVGEAMDNPSIDDGCGGVHRLLGLSSAVARQTKAATTLTGHFVRAAKFVAEFQDYAFRLQNGNGGWHPSFFAAMGASGDPSGSLRSSGHIAHWLAVSLPDARIEDPRIARAIAYLCELLGYQEARWDVGDLSSRDLDSLSHALAALTRYDQRVFLPCDPPPGAKPAVREAPAASETPAQEESQEN